MGKINSVMHHYMRDKRRFADLFNGVFFRGEAIIRPEDLTEISGHYTETEAESGTGQNIGGRLERIRDIEMCMKNGKTLRLLALENQNGIDYTMPFRCMQYDVMDYRKQIDERKRRNKIENTYRTMDEKICGLRKLDRLTPVYTLCLYHGEDKWDGPRSLREMMDFGEDKEEMNALFADYPLRLYCVGEEKDFSLFNTELRTVFRTLKYRKDKRELKKLVEAEPEFRQLDRDTVEVMATLLKVPKIWEERGKYMNGNEEEYDMCQALQEMLMDERIEGKKAGIEEGIKEGIKAFIESGRELGIREDMVEAKLKEKFLLTDEDVQRYMKEF